MTSIIKKILNKKLIITQYIKQYLYEKIFLLLLLITHISYSYSQNRNIIIDQTNTNERFIEAQGKTIRKFTDTKILNIALQLKIKQNDTTFYINTNVNTLVPLQSFDEALCLIKLSDGEIIELKSIKANNNVTEVKYGNPTVTTTQYKNRVHTTYNNNSVNVVRNINYWPIKPNIIEKFKKGVIKIKIQFKNANYERNFKKDEIGTMIYDSYLSILKYIHTYNNANDKFRENF